MATILISNDPIPPVAFESGLPVPRLPGEMEPSKGWKARLRNWLKQSALNDTRLYCVLVDYSYSLRSRAMTAGRSDEPDYTLASEVIEHCCELFAKAVQAYEARNNDAAWRLLRSAMRYEIALFTPSEILSKAQELDREKVKLKEWRREAVTLFLTPILICERIGACERAELAEFRNTLVKAQEVRDEFFDNEHFRKQVLRRRVNPIAWIFLTVAVAFPFLRPYLALDEAAFPDGPLLGLTVLFGFLGACASVVSNLTTNYETSNLIKQFTEWTDSLRRLSFGPIAALVVVLATKAELISVLKPPETAVQYCCYAFVAGFGERLVMQLVDKLGGKGNS